MFTIFSAETQVMQRISGCELLDNDQEGRVVIMEAFNGEPGDQVHYNKHQGLFLSDMKWPLVWNPTFMKYKLKVVYLPLCIHTLSTTLQVERNYVMRRGNSQSQMFKGRFPDTAHS